MGAVKDRLLLKSCIALVLTGVLLASSPLIMAEAGEGLSAEAQSSSQPWSLPDYMKNWEFGIDIDEGRGPRSFADLFFPLWRPDAETRILFFEPRFNVEDGHGLFNLGLGYRQLIRDRSWMLGSNLFYDYETEHSHYRVGTGLEALTSYAQLRSNIYVAISPARITQSGTASNIIEEAVTGFDLEAGVPIPYYSKLKVFGGYEWYNFEKFENREGWSVRAEYEPIRAIVVDLILHDNNKRQTGWGVKVAFRLPFGENSPAVAPSPFQLDKVIFPDSDATEHLLRLVERHHEIVVESYTESVGSISVEIRRGT